jgi:hypothetical protein|tara:strand:- start:1192 stop:1341 length:150 start_codon:yes stop_codon:yes gene_type:complete
MLGNFNKNLKLISKYFTNKFISSGSKTAIYFGLAVYWMFIAFGTYVSVI